MTWRPDQPIVWEEKTTAPGATDDENNNYLVGDLWIDETHDLVYICVDDVAGAAVWTNVVGTGSAPSFTTVKLTDLTDGYIPYHVNDATGLANGPTKANVDSAISLMHAEVHTQGVAYGGTNLTSYAVGDLLYASATTTLAKLADVAAGSYLRSGGITTAPLWSTLILPNAATAFRLPVATSINTIGELAASGATGEYLAGVTGAIPAWATLNQAAIAGLTTVSSPAFATVKLSDLTDGYIPYHINDTTGLANGPTKADVDDAVSKKHSAGSDFLVMQVFS